MSSDSHTNGQPRSGDEPAASAPDESISPAPRRRRFRPAALATGVALGVAVALIGILIMLFATRGERIPEVTLDELDAAERRWNERGPASYRMNIAVGGRQPGPVEIEVHEGRVTRMTRDGVTPSQQRTWEYWTTPEQFETIRQDIDSAHREGGFGAPPGTKTILRASFDPQYGYPRHYQRMVLGTDLNLDWSVISFEALVDRPVEDKR
jgi:hypothetical protein